MHTTARIIITAFVLASCRRSAGDLVPYPCGGQRPAALPRPAPLSAAAGEVVGIVEIPWSGAIVVELDTPDHRVMADESGKFALRNVSSGRHIVITRALGFEPQRDSIDVSPRGTFVSIRPRRLAACLLSR